MKTFRILENSGVYWHGKAHNIDHALEKCYDDETPGSLTLLQVDEWATVHFTKQIKGKGWVKRWQGKIPSYS